MNISWVIAEGYQFDPIIDIDTIKDIGPIWGSWSTWRGCGTDNVVCNDSAKAHELIDRGFHDSCNFYIPKKVCDEFANIPRVMCYGGQFEHALTKTDDIVSLHLASSSDLLLLLGFSLNTMTKSSDRHYYGHILSLVKNNPNVQFVLVDHPGSLDKNFKDLPNLTCDTLGNVLQLLAQ